MTDRTSRGPIAVLCGVLALSAAALAIAWGSDSWSTKPGASAPKLHVQAVEAVHVISPHLSYARETALVPKDHYWGILAGAVTTCGAEGVNLSPQEMARRPVTVTLWHQGAPISSVRLARRSGFAFLVVGGNVVRFPLQPQDTRAAVRMVPGFHRSDEQRVRGLLLPRRPRRRRRGGVPDPGATPRPSLLSEPTEHPGQQPRLDRPGVRAVVRDHRRTSEPCNRRARRNGGAHQ